MENVITEKIISDWMKMGNYRSTRRRRAIAPSNPSTILCTLAGSETAAAAEPRVTLIPKLTDGSQSSTNLSGM